MEHNGQILVVFGLDSWSGVTFAQVSVVSHVVSDTVRLQMSWSSLVLILTLKHTKPTLSNLLLLPKEYIQKMWHPCNKFSIKKLWMVKDRWRRMIHYILINAEHFFLTHMDIVCFSHGRVGMMSGESISRRSGWKYRLQSCISFTWWEWAADFVFHLSRGWRTKIKCSCTSGSRYLFTSH